MLVTDRREIEFDRESLAYYFSILPREAEKLGLPGTPPSEIRFDPEEGVVDAIYGPKEQGQSFALAPEPLSAMLITYCIRTGIPLPRVADKIVRVKADRVVLTFKTWFDEPPVFEVKEEAIRAGETTKSWKWVEPGRPAQGF